MWEVSIYAIKTWSGWAFIGLILIGTGVFNLGKVAIFALRSFGTTGEWHFRLTQDELVWQFEIMHMDPKLVLRRRDPRSKT